MSPGILVTRHDARRKICPRGRAESTTQIVLDGGLKEPNKYDPVWCQGHEYGRSFHPSPSIQPRGEQWQLIARTNLVGGRIAGDMTTGPQDPIEEERHLLYALAASH
jgi:hypothetical protein